jgi:hypothetical protein
VTRTSNCWFTGGWLTIFSTAAALTASEPEESGVSRTHHAGHGKTCRKHP